MSRWIGRWEVTGRSGTIWIVAQDVDGNYGCSCPVWTFHRKQCHHIDQVKENPNNPGMKKEDIGAKGRDFDPFTLRYQMIPKLSKNENKPIKKKVTKKMEEVENGDEIMPRMEVIDAIGNKHELDYKVYHVAMSGHLAMTMVFDKGKGGHYVFDSHQTKQLVKGIVNELG